MQQVSQQQVQIHGSNAERAARSGIFFGIFSLVSFIANTAYNINSANWLGFTAALCLTSASSFILFGCARKWHPMLLICTILGIVAGCIYGIGAILLSVFLPLWISAGWVTALIVISLIFSLIAVCISFWLAYGCIQLILSN